MEKKNKAVKWCKRLRTGLLLYLLLVPYEMKEEEDGQFKISGVLYQITKKKVKPKEAEEGENKDEAKEAKDENEIIVTFGGFLGNRAKTVKQIISYFSKAEKKEEK